MEIDRGYISPQFMTTERSLCEFDNCRVLVTDQKVDSVGDLVPILEQVTRVSLSHAHSEMRGRQLGAGAPRC